MKAIFFRHGARLVVLFVIALLLPFASSTSLAAGNSALMQRAKQRAFKLNEQIFQKLEHLDLGDDSALSFIGRVVRNADGQLVISIDEVNPLPSRYRAAPAPNIQYITFEEMQAQPKPQVNTPSDTPPSSSERPVMGGGAATLQ